MTEETDERKSVDLEAHVRKIRDGWYSHFRADLMKPALPMPDDTYVETVLDDAVIVRVAGELYRVPYAEGEDAIAFSPREQWQKAKLEYVADTAKSLGDDELITFGAELKALGDGRVSGYLVRFGTPEQADPRGDYFDAETDFDIEPGAKTPVWFNHRLPLRLPTKARVVVREKIGEGTLAADDIGVLIDAIIYNRELYEQVIVPNVKRLGWSSGSAPHLVDREPVDGAQHITRWPLGLDASITPIPADVRNGVVALKSLEGLALPEAGPEAGQPAAPAAEHPESPSIQPSIKSETEEEQTMGEELTLEAIKGAFGELLKPVVNDVAALKAQVEKEPPVPAGGMQTDPPGGGGEVDVTKAVNILRLGETDDYTEVVMKDLFGGDWRQAFFEQNRDFVKYLRTGEGDRNPRQVWGPKAIKQLLVDGLSVAEIKATMVEGTDILGGYAVPPEASSDIIGRLPGLTAVRGGGAMIVNTVSKSIEWLQITGGNGTYPSGMRGVWGAETTSPSATNFTVGLLNIPVKVYTYKVPMSVSLIEDASNIVEIFQRMVTQTLALDEDVAFLVGDGNQDPHGILPDQANARSLTEVITGDADDLTWAGLRKLRRGIDSQYRAMGQCTFIGNSQSGEDIEQMVDGLDNYRVEILEQGTRFLGGQWRESEALPDPGSAAYPVVFGNLSGYAIVQRLGLAVQRYNDSNTGVNKVEFHVRRRIGGDLVEPWKFAVQKCATS